MIRSVLVALDGSTRAAGAHLHLFRAVPVPPEFPPAGASSHADALPDHLAREAWKEILDLTQQAPGLGFTIRIDASHQPLRAILAASEELDVDLIVVGSHGYHGLDHLLGTTSAKVANLARRNVLVIHNAAELPAARPSRPSTRIL
jgi:nucleotide-binding universal stress UspA family protein